MGAGLTIIAGFAEGAFPEGAWGLSAFSSSGMNLNHWADGVWAEGSWVPESWGGSPEAPAVVGSATPGIDWRFNLPRRRRIKPEEEAVAIAAPVAVEPQTTVDAVVDPAMNYEAVARSIEIQAREAYLQEHARLMASESVRRAKRKRQAETLLLLM